jgi:hydroxysqualene dehydroxylase
MDKPKNIEKIAIIGAGWAGISAALTLAQSGAHVVLFERSPHAGGRAARAYAVHDKAPFALDNGQHVMIGAYSHVLSLLHALGVNTETALLRLPAQWLVPQQMAIKMPVWCAAYPNLWNGVFKQVPMALGLLRDAWLHGGFSAAIGAAMACLRMSMQPARAAETVDSWLRRVGWSQRYMQHLWRPLCAATLNTPSHKACAVSFARVVKDGLMAGPSAAAMLVPRTDLGTLLPDPALRCLKAIGVDVRLHTAVTQLSYRDSKPSIHGEVFHRVIVATPPKDAWRLLAPFAQNMQTDCYKALEALANQRCEPISTLHFFVGNTRLSSPVLILPNSLQTVLHNAVLIDRSYLSEDQAGWMTVVISSSHRAVAHFSSENAALLTHAVVTDLQALLPEYNWLTHSPSVLIHAKQATFSCTPRLTRPGRETGLSGVQLIGDYVASIENYPSTLEGAVRSGQRITGDSADSCDSLTREVRVKELI